MGRDISRGRTYRNSKILSSDLTPGNRLISWECEANKIEWVTTPGHTGHCCSLFISGHIQIGSTDLKRERRVAFVGDLWDEENDEEFWRDISEYPEIQAKSREYVIQQNFDLIIPGHGPPFTSKCESLPCWLVLFYLMIMLSFLEKNIQSNYFRMCGIAGLACCITSQAASCLCAACPTCRNSTSAKIM